ncbi:hypothetical protein CV694_06500, partial [Borreliella burgdorferi]
TKITKLLLKVKKLYNYFRYMFSLPKLFKKKTTIASPAPTLINHNEFIFISTSLLNSLYILLKNTSFSLV